MVKKLIPKYEKPFVPTENGKTLIHLAVISGNLKFLEILGDFFDDLNTKDNDGQTPIEIAQYLEDEKMIEFLEKSVKCDYCSTKFKRLSSKQRHTKNIHGIIESNPDTNNDDENVTKQHPTAVSSPALPREETELRQLPTEKSDANRHLKVGIMQKFGFIYILLLY